MDPKVLKAVLETPAEGEDKFIAALKTEGITDQEKIDAQVAKFRLQKGLADKFDEKDDAAFLKALGIEIPAKADPAAKGGKSAPAKKTDDPADPKKTDESSQTDVIAKAIGALGPEIKAVLEPLAKSNEALQKGLAEAHSVIKGLTDEKIVEGYVRKAEDLDFVPGDTHKLALMMKDAYGVSDDFGKGFETLLSQVNIIVEKSALLGSSGHPFLDKGQDAWADLEQLSKGIVQKSSDVTMTEAKAMDLVLKTEEGQRLYKLYLKENPAQRSQYMV